MKITRERIAYVPIEISIESAEEKKAMKEIMSVYLKYGQDPQATEIAGSALIFLENHD